MKVDKGVSVANIVPEKATSFESSRGNPGIQSHEMKIQTRTKLDPVGSTVRYEMTKLCTGIV